MQLILFLLGLFAIGCLLYGISAGVRIIQRGFAWLAGGTGNNATSTEPSPGSLHPVCAKTAAEPVPRQQDETPWRSASGASPVQRSIDELRDIFALYQQGALTQEEFEGMKRCLLSNIKADALQSQ